VKTQAHVSGDLLLRHLRCCQANNKEPGWCEGSPHFIGVSFTAVLSAIRTLPKPLRHAAICYARVGPDLHNPRISWHKLAQRRSAAQAALLVEAALCR